MGKKKEEKKILTPEEILKHLSGEVIQVLLPEWGEGVAVPAKVPSQEELCRIRLQFPDKEKFENELFKACLVDIDGKKLDELKKTGNGVKYGQLFQAVMKSADLWGMAVKTEEQKK